MEGQPREGDDGSPVERGFIKAVDQMDRSRTSRSDTDTQASAVLGEARRHERSRFLVAYANVLDAVLALTQGFDDRIYTVTDYTEDMCCAPIDQSFAACPFYPFRRSASTAFTVMAWSVAPRMP